MDAIQIAGLTRRFRRVDALRGVDLTVPGGMFGLLGSNGAGKTTLMRTLAGVLRPTSGTVIVNGHDLTSRDGRLAVQRRLGYLPQDVGVYPDLTAAQFLDYVALLKGLDDSTARRRQIEALLDTVGLSDVAGRRLKGFSGGMRRRVGIAQALLGDPTLIIVDEPTAGLDPEERIRFRTLLSTIATGRTVLLSTHIVEDVAQTCGTTAVMAAGRVIYTGPVSDVVAAGNDRTWEISRPGSAGPLPPGAGTVVSAVAVGAAVTYRVIAEGQPAADATPVAPTLEDGYVALMHRARTAEAGSGVGSGQLRG
ncbi:ABC transporter ATP-binding protein [Cryptosporangium arvum]|uniref:ABC-type multidrug transport system, ATPase component n=1 Tax=Cryptosporangium arvum DSM 44712 TaxID=927661 RepID=A0A010Z4T3_9ACTN|nr:ABC transporter ATP-binding protein [Cryptosporangium arvum]EXG82358.1 ABC-type multidrug transport system, ATPase component [Cryptosporangium arvum DSM 44712]